MFNPQFIKLPKEIYTFKQDHFIKTPTSYALISGGYWAGKGYKPIFEAKFDQMHVDLFLPEKDLIIEIHGDRTKEQSNTDSNRDGRLVEQQKYVQRIHNNYIVEYVPKEKQMDLYFTGVDIFIEQLKDWKENGIPDYDYYDDHNEASNKLDDDSYDFLKDWNFEDDSDQVEPYH